MGEKINKDHFTDGDYQLFQQKLEQEMAFVRQLFSEKQFDNHTRKLGYEVELCLLDANGGPAASNQQVLDKTDNPLFTNELAKYNLEINGNAFDICPQVFNSIESDLNGLYDEINAAAENCDLQTGLFGVLPSLQHEHIDSEHYMSEGFRYRLLSQRLIEMRQRPVRLDITGDDQLSLEHNDLMLEALSTSLQTHLQVPFDEAVDSYHAALWASMAVLAAGANSPLIMGKKCWHESRIAIFQQSVDTRSQCEVDDAIIPRVHFGKGYINSWMDLFEDNGYYSPILPETKDCDISKLHHFNLHNGTIWRWVRPILGRVEDQYHLRLELRVSPSGPTPIDTLANMVFSIGLLEGLKQSPANLTRIPFEVLEADFYRVAQEGLKAQVTWCDGTADSIQNIILSHALPIAAKGLEALKIEDADRWLNIIEGRVASGRTGAAWILNCWDKKQDSNALVRTYMQYARTNTPVHRWTY